MRDFLLAANPVLVVVIIFGFFGLVFVAAVVRSVARDPKRRLERRMADMSGRKAARRGKDKGENLSLRKDTRDTSSAGIERVIKTLVPRPAVLRSRLARTSRRIPLGTYVLVCLTLGAVAFYSFGMLLKLGTLIGVLCAIVFGMGIPHFVIGRMIKKREKKFMGEFPEAIDVLVRGLRSGLPITESMNIISTEMKGPVSEEFQLVSDGMALGRTLEEEMALAVDRIAIPEFKFFAVSLAIQRETGGNLAETLSNLSEILRKRRQMRLKIKAMSAEARASAIIIGSLPFIVFGIIFTLNPGYATQLFTDPRGVIMLIAGFASLSIGIAVMAKLIRFEI